MTRTPKLTRRSLLATGAGALSLGGLGVRPARAGVGDAASAEPLALAGNLNAWTDAESTDGVVYQLIEKGAG